MLKEKVGAPEVHSFKVFSIQEQLIRRTNSSGIDLRDDIYKQRGKGFVPTRLYYIEGWCILILYELYRPCTSLPKVNLYITVLGGDLNGEFVFHVTIKIHYSFIVYRITFSQEDVHLQSFTEKYFIINKLFLENWVKFKIQNLP